VKQLRELRTQLRDDGRLVAGDSRPADRELSSTIDKWQDRANGYECEPRRFDNCLVVPDHIAMFIARLNAAAGRWNPRRWEEAEHGIATLIERLEQRNSLDAERIVDFGLRAECARALRHSGHREEALREIVEGVVADPMSIDAHREAGRVHYSLGQYAEALNSWQHVLELAPNDAYTHLDVARCCRQVATCHRAGGETGSDRDHGEKALAQAAEHLDDALLLFDSEDTVGAAWARVWGGRVALERGHVGDSLTKLTGALEGPASLAAWLFLGEAQLAAGEPQLADNAFKRCRAAIPTVDPAQLPYWSDQLPIPAIRCRLSCGIAKRQLAHSGVLTEADLQSIGHELRSAAKHAQGLTDNQLRQECEALHAEAEARLIRAGGRIDPRESVAARRMATSKAAARRRKQPRARQCHTRYAARHRPPEQRLIAGYS